MAMVILSETGPQGPAGSLVVRVSVTVPAVLSAAEGLYTALRVLAFGAYVPVPPDQAALTAEPPMLPARVAEARAHIDWSGPALTVAAGNIVTVIASLAAGQGPAGSLVVSVRVTAPAVISAALGV